MTMINGLCHWISKITISDTMITRLNVGLAKITKTNTMITESHAGSKITITYILCLIQRSP